VEVVLGQADGTRQRVAILGEWDRDEVLGIIPNRSRLAQALEGRRAGEQVTIPGAQGDEAATVLSIEPLSEAVRTWAGAPAPGTDKV
ncbi:MAG: GreA/GreB family elongation factor, partial [Kiritimatiellae bacterium]|nr:GreA/GreB family elongation factor [Kiritimatiellia bacterium]